MSTCSGIQTNILSCDGGGDTGIWSILSLVINIFSIGIGVLAVTGIVIVGVQYITAAGDVGKTTKAKRRMFEIVLGLAAYVLLWALLQWLVPGGIFHPMDPIDSISIELNRSSAYVGEYTSISVKVLPESANDRTFSLNSSNTSVATVGSGVVRCVGAGSATITAMAVDGKTSTATITCSEKPKDTPKTNTDSDDDSHMSNADSTDYYKIYDYKLEQADVENYKFVKDPTYEDIVKLAEARGIKENSDQFYAVVGWTQREGYWAAYAHPDKYLGYLSACVLINNVKADKNYVKGMEVWGYNLEFLKEQTRYAKNYSPTLKSLYLALKYPYPKINQCWGNYGKVPKNLVYEGLNNSNERIFVFY